MANIEACNVKDVLISGATKEELVKALNDAIAIAEKEIAEDKAKKAKEEKYKKQKDEIRMNLVHATIDYLDAIGLVEKDSFTEADYNEIATSIKDVESNSLLSLLQIKNFDLPEKTKGKDRDIEIDDIIKKFLKSL